MVVGARSGLYRRALELIPGGVNSPVRAMRSVGLDEPLFVRRGPLRASHRDELGRLYHSGCLLRVLTAELRPAPHVDYHG